MLAENLFEALQWAQRYCIDYQTESDNISQVFFKEFSGSIASKLSHDQIEHLKVDVRRFIQERERLQQYYPEIEVHQVVYDYLNLLNSLDGSSKPTSKLPRKTIFKIVYWAAEYCITRRSYAAAYGRDVVKFLPKFSPVELRFLKNQLDTRIKEYEARRQNSESDSIYNEKLNSSWYNLYNILNTWDCQNFLEVTAEYNGETKTEICFEDSEGIKRIVSEFFINPYVPCYFHPDYVVEVKHAEGKRNIKGELIK